jgi:hypothetical protein
MEKDISERRIDGIYRELCRRQIIAPSTQSAPAVKELILEVSRILRDQEQVRHMMRRRPVDKRRGIKIVKRK